MITTDHYVFWVTIKVRDRGTRDTLAFLKWENLRFESRVKWDWYFKYRAALLQVQHPRAEVELYQGKEIPSGDKLEISLRNRIRAKKNKITELNNKMAKARKEWNSLFPIEEHPLHAKAVGKIERLKAELAIMEKEVKVKP